MDTLEDEGPVRLAGDTVATAHDWDLAAAAVLRKARRLPADAPAATAWEVLARTTVEGLVIPPLGTAQRLADAGGSAFAGSGAIASGAAIARAESGWEIRSLITDPDPGSASAAAVADLENGATSLWFTVGGRGTAPADLTRAMDGVFPEMAAVVVSASGAVTDRQAAAALTDLFRARGITPDPGSSLGADPVGRQLRTAGITIGDRSGLIEDFREITAMADDLGIRALTVDGSIAHHAGAGDAQELGYSLAVGAEYLRALEATDCGVDEALGLLEFRYAATDEQFTTIAKFRAARGLWSRVAELSGAAAGSAAQLQHAVTSLPMLTRYDPWVNLLRTTIAAFAAGVGGADAVTVLPFDSRLGIPDALGRRMARNTSSLLIAESHVAAVADPAAGSPAVEMLTRTIAETAWAEFQLIERAGGILTALGDGSVQTRWAATAAERRRRIATRRSPITGVSEFPNLREVLPARRQFAADSADSADSAEVAESAAWAEPFEAMRDEPAELPVFLATLGPIADHAARAGFAANLFAAGGIDTVTAGRTDDVAGVLAAFADTGTTVACLTGSDRAYAAIGAEVVAGLRTAGAAWVVLAGKPTVDLGDLVDDTVAAGDDVVDFLRRTRRQLLPTQVGT